MSLLNRGTEVVTVFPEEVTTDGDGNIRTRPTATGVVCRAVVQPMTTAEDQTTGFDTTSKYRLLLWVTRHCSVLSHRWNGRASGTQSTENPRCTTALVVPLTSITSWCGAEHSSV